MCLADLDGAKRFDTQCFFSVGNTATSYRLTIGGHADTAGDCKEDTWVQPSVHLTRTMTYGVTAVLWQIKEHGDITSAILAISMDHTFVHLMLAKPRELL